MRAIVLSGGGSKGAHSAGIIKYLLGDLQLHYDIICGVSVGAINGSFLAQFPKGQEKLAADKLVNLWSKLDSPDIYKRWFPFGSFHIVHRKSFYDSLPLQQLIREKISLDKIRASGKKIAIGAVSISSGKYTIFNEGDDDLIEGIIGSSAFPGMLTPIETRGQLWFDGGMKTLSPINTAIELGATTIDVITTSPEVRNKKFFKNPSIIDIFMRAIDLSTDKILSNDIERALMYNELAKAGVSDKKVIELNIIRPDYNLISNLLDFSPDKIKEMIEKGYADAKKKYPVK